MTNINSVVDGFPQTSQPEMEPKVQKIEQIGSRQQKKNRIADEVEVFRPVVLTRTMGLLFRMGSVFRRYLSLIRWISVRCSEKHMPPDCFVSVDESDVEVEEISDGSKFVWRTHRVSHVVSKLSTESQMETTTSPGARSNIFLTYWTVSVRRFVSSHFNGRQVRVSATMLLGARTRISVFTGSISSSGT